MARVPAEMEGVAARVQVVVQVAEVVDLVVQAADKVVLAEAVLVDKAVLAADVEVVLISIFPSSVFNHFHWSPFFNPQVAVEVMRDRQVAKAADLAEVVEVMRDNQAARAVDFVVVAKGEAEEETDQGDLAERVDQVPEEVDKVADQAVPVFPADPADPADQVVPVAVGSPAAGRTAQAEAVELTVEVEEETAAVWVAAVWVVVVWADRALLPPKQSLGKQTSLTLSLLTQPKVQAGKLAKFWIWSMLNSLQL